MRFVPDPGCELVTERSPSIDAMSNVRHYKLVWGLIVGASVGFLLGSYTDRMTSHSVLEGTAKGTFGGALFGLLVGACWDLWLNYLQTNFPALSRERAAKDAAGTVPRRWFQFTLGGIFWATFWVGVSFGSWFVLYRTVVSSDRVAMAAIAGLTIGPFIAAASLFGRPLVGMAIGILVVLAFGLGLYISINNGWISFP